MNHRIPATVSLAVLLTLAPLLACAQQAAPATATSYPEWDKLSAAQHELLIAPLRERWNANPEERPRLLERAQRWQQMPKAQRMRAREGLQRWDAMSPQQREQARALFHALRGMDKDARRAFLDQWQQMSPQQRADWAKAHPAPPRPDGP